MITLDRTFSSLRPNSPGDSARLAQGETTVGELAEPFHISPPAISRHLKVLEEAWLISNEREGKHRGCRLNPETLAAWRVDRFSPPLLERKLRPPRRPFEKASKGKKAMTWRRKIRCCRSDAHVEAPPARVFDAWLTGEEWQAWIGPEGAHCEVPLFEPRVGGRYRMIMRMSGGRVIPVAGVSRDRGAQRASSSPGAGKAMRSGSRSSPSRSVISAERPS